MLNKITKLFSKQSKEAENPEFYKLIEAIISEAKSKNNSDVLHHYSLKFNDLESYKSVKSKKPEAKKAFTYWLVHDIERIYRLNKNKEYKKRAENDVFYCQQELLPLVFRSNLGLTDDDIIYFFNYFRTSKLTSDRQLEFWPIGFFVQQIERKIKKEGISDILITFLKEVLTWEELDADYGYWGTDLAKVKKKIETIVFQKNKSEGDVLAFQFNENNDDQIGIFCNALLKETKQDDLKALYPILHLSYKVSGGKPSKKFLTQTSALIDTIEFKDYKAFAYKVIEKVIEIEPRRQEITNTHHGETYSYWDTYFIERENSNTLKGFVWTLSKFHDTKTLTLLAKLAERCYKKIPGIGPVAAAIGNAAIYVLGHTKGMDGIAKLTVLKQRIKQPSAKKIIDKYIVESSERLGVSQSDLEESVTPEFGLQNGSKIITFKDYNFQVSIERVGKIAASWIKPDGKLQKTTPAFVKDSKELSDKLKKIKLEVKEIQKFLSSQKERLDDLFLEEKQIPFSNFDKYYFNHGLLSFLTQRLIWIISGAKHKTTAYYLNDNWIDSNQTKIEWINDSCTFQLWHPVYSTTNEVLQWREFLIQHEIVQPLKQAFREIYVLTPAEVNTKNYSNRMASHILKQHQFSTLAKIRHWKYQLIGAWDHGSDCIARKLLSKWQIEAEYWLNEIYDENQINDAGILLYMSTDQVRFTKLGEPMDMVDVPKIVFSEIMRDVDLFVGVCSVGNDPEWQDNGGLPQYRDYWHSYSFGDLTEVAKTRKIILEGLIPRLKIKDKAQIDGKFLIVKGQLRTYKIHIGSTNILMEPNDQYLCIVPSGKSNATDKVYLPFDGDKGLSVIISKAFLLAEDEKITDPTITSQLKL